MNGIFDLKSRFESVQKSEREAVEELETIACNTNKEGIAVVLRSFAKAFLASREKAGEKKD